MLVICFIRFVVSLSFGDLQGFCNIPMKKD